MLSSRQQEIITGSLLGDGTIWTDFKDHWKYQITQSQKDKSGDDKYSYLLWFATEFCLFGCSIREQTYKVSGLLLECGLQDEYQGYVLTTKLDYGWHDIEKKWYVPRTDHHHFKRRKVVPQDIKLTPLSLCVWHMDDGYNNPKDANIELNTQGFTIEEVDFLIERLDVDLGIKSKKKKEMKRTSMKANQFKIYVGRKSYFDFMEMIKPHVKWDCFKYKTDTSAYTKKPLRGETHPLAKLTENDVRTIFTMKDIGCSHAEISSDLGVSEETVSMILSGKRWGHLGLSRPVKRKPRIAEESKQKVLTLAGKGRSQNEIAALMGMNQSTVSRILRK